MANFIDRRLNSKNKSTVNRQRFIRRYKSQIKKSVEQAVNKRGVTDVDSGENITITKKPRVLHGGVNDVLSSDPGGRLYSLHLGNINAIGLPFAPLRRAIISWHIHDARYQARPLIGRQVFAISPRWARVTAIHGLGARRNHAGNNVSICVIDACGHWYMLIEGLTRCK